MRYFGIAFRYWHPLCNSSKNADLFTRIVGKKINMLSLYIHVPYCVKKCLYCGFYSTPYSPQDADAFIAALRKDAEQWRNIITDGRSVGSIYIGGGTPTVLSIEQLGQVIAVLKQYFLFQDGVEFTVEANPNTVSHDYFPFLLEQGVNRLSLGIQSFSDTILCVLGRPHNAQQAADVFMHARCAGFKNIGIDLIFGIPGQTMTEWEKTVDAAITLKPEHISAYSLSLDEGSQFMRNAKAGMFVLPEEGVVAEMYEQAVRLFSDAGYGRYEISNFSLPGFACLHNQNYWNRGEYLGLGPGASSFVDGKRYVAIADSVEYVRRLSSGLSTIGSEETVDMDSAAQETLMLGLRTTQGVDLHRFQRAYGTGLLNRLKERIGPLEAAGILVMTDGCLRLTDRGFLLSDEALIRLST
jgi:oxygen-independent coproporphyrinogen-3 oxidase